MVNTDIYIQLLEECKSKNVTLVAVSKTKPIEDILELYHLGQRDFGENYVQELVEKQAELPKDIRWHFIGHLQTNKVKQIISFVELIQSVDSLKLLKEIDKQSAKINKKTNCLLQVFIAKEETKFGLNEDELNEVNNQFNNSAIHNINVIGLMGMATNTNDESLIRKEFQHLQSLQQKLQTTNYKLSTLSMGMTADYKIAIEEGSNFIRVGSLIFGARN